jgi:hypothetical protein
MGDGWSVLFVDVGYLLAAVGETHLGTTSRSDIMCDYDGLCQALAGHVRSRGEDWPLLRTYWYDASVGGTPSPEHDRIAALPGLKLRLGRLVRGSQKGVDSRIVRDLIVLARDRVVRAAYLIAGDEDVREGVAEAQDNGVRVVLLGIEGMSPSYTLVQEVDEHSVLPRSFWKPWFASPGPQPVPYALQAQPSKVGGVVSGEEAKAQAAGRKFAVEWADGMGWSELHELVAPQSAWIPPEVHSSLLKAAEEELGPLWERADLKQLVRAGFWEGLREAEARTAAPTPM